MIYTFMDVTHYFVTLHIFDINPRKEREGEVRAFLLLIRVVKMALKGRRDQRQRKSYASQARESNQPLIISRIFRRAVRVIVSSGL